MDTGGHLPAVGTLPIPSNAHWMPLASIVEVPFIWLLGPTYLASCLPFWILAALGASITYLLGMDAGLGRRTSIAAGLLMAMPGAVAPYMSQPDNFSLYMVLGVTALWLCVRGAAGNRWAFALGGVFVGLAMLARTDGVLLGVPFIVAFVAEQWPRWRGRWRRRARRPGRRPDRRRLAGARPDRLDRGHRLLRPLPAGHGALVDTRPAAVRVDLAVVLQRPDPLDPDLQQLFSVSDQTTPATFFAQGLGPLLASRIGGLGAAIIVLGHAAAPDRAGAVHADRDVDPPPQLGVPTVARVRRHVPGVQRARLRGPPAVRDGAALGHGAGAARVPALDRGSSARPCDGWPPGAPTGTCRARRATSP